MNGHALRVLEYDRLRELVSRAASSDPGRERVLELEPASDGATATLLLAETAEFMQLLQAGEEPPLDGVRDIGSSLARLGVNGAVLQPAELLNIAATLATGRKVKAFFTRITGRSGRSVIATVPLLSARASEITPLKEIEDAVTGALDDTGEVKDSASPELRRLRKLIARVRDEVLHRLEKVLRAAGTQSVVQEQVITVRDDRYVVPLKPGFRQSVKGVVHGRSGSRATLFVEPLEVLEQNNRLAELRAEEREETARILRELTECMAGRAGEMTSSLRALASIDCIGARARFGAAVHGTVPMLSPGRGLRLREARHPLLVTKQTGSVVPNDLDLTEGRRTLIISGPNAGGKTVVLKTVGLLCLMAQSGIPVTAGEGSELPPFSDVFADIGDEQSLEQDLSTFSSHIQRIAEILRSADRDSLVLLDELGAGTDPAEGAALGSAVLQQLLHRGCTTVVTTHHSGLKLFGSRTAGAVNAAMEFDAETLRPTYRFLPGMPGRSYGLDMAARIGVPDDVVRDARSRLSGDEAGLDRLLEQVERDSRRLRQEREQAEEDRITAKRLRTEAEALAKAASEEARSTRLRAKQDARDVLADLRQKLKDLARSPSMSIAEVESERRSVEVLAERLEPRDDEYDEHATALPQDLHPGDRVRVPRLRKTGSVLFVHKDGIEIDSGGLKLRVPAREVMLLHDAAAPGNAATTGWSADLEVRAGIPDRLNLRGMRVEEALAEVERFLDRANMQGFQSVLVIHGLGTGALKSAVTGFLKGHPLIASLRPGEPSEGGAGVTVAGLKR
jgi:DNA mismatch repair protein MutS2